jgi:hypothetical protein
LIINDFIESIAMRSDKLKQLIDSISIKTNSRLMSDVQVRRKFVATELGLGRQSLNNALIADRDVSDQLTAAITMLLFIVENNYYNEYIRFKSNMSKCKRIDTAMSAMQIDIVE